MAKQKIERIAADVATLLGETILEECQPEESPYPGIEERVRILAPALLTSMLMEIPVESSADFTKSTPSISIDGEGTVSFPLPADFLRLVSVKMSDWLRSVTNVTPLDSETGRIQESPVKALRGTRERPVAVISIGEDRNRAMMLFSSGSGNRLEHFLYYAVPQIAADDTLDIPQPLYHRLIIQLAEKIRTLLPPSSGQESGKCR